MWLKIWIVQELLVKELDLRDEAAKKFLSIEPNWIGFLPEDGGGVPSPKCCFKIRTMYNVQKVDHFIEMISFCLFIKSKSIRVAKTYWVQYVCSVLTNNIRLERLSLRYLFRDLSVSCASEAHRKARPHGKRPFLLSNFNQNRNCQTTFSRSFSYRLKKNI
jgi:hypothetical protein